MQGGAAMQGDYDALADLFLSPDHARNMLSQPGRAMQGPLASEGGPALRFPQPREAVRNAGLNVGLATAAIENAPRTEQAIDQARATTLRVEGLILGHLPVLGGAWVGQYAKHIASQTHEPVVLVRIQEGQLSIDLVTPIGSPARANSRVGAPSMDPGATTLDGAIAIARREAGRWLVRVDEVQETEMLSLHGIDAITLLTGADDAAVVASYRTLKHFCRELHARATDGTTDEATGEVRANEITLGIAILGADSTRADEAEAKLREGARTFLATPLPPAAKVGKISPGTTMTVYRAALTGGASQTLASILSLVRTVSGHSNTYSQQVPSAVAFTAPQATARVSSSSPVRAAQGMAQLLGLHSCDVTCPYAGEIELAWAADGSLHLLAEHNTGSVRDLLVAASWANDHRGLLVRLVPLANATQPANSSSAWGPTLHVITRDLPAVRALLDTAIRVHVLVEVKLPGGGVAHAMTAAN